MRTGALFLAGLILASANAHAGSPPKGCYEKSWSKGELKRLPQQQVTAIRIEANLGAPPESKPHAFGKLMARFRDSGEAWLATSFECSDTGAGLACASYCDGSIFVLSAGGRGLQLAPPKGVLLAGPDCEGGKATLQLNPDQLPFVLARRGSKACPAP